MLADTVNKLHKLDLFSLFLLALHGSLIKWYFKTIVCSGALRFNMILGRMISQTYHQNVQRIECSEAVQELDYELPHHVKVSKQ